MTSPITNFLSPLATPLPPYTQADPFTPEQWTTLMSIMDTVIPSIHSSSSTSTTDEKSHLAISPEQYAATTKHIRSRVAGDFNEETLDRYFQEKASDVPEMRELLKRTFSCNVPPKGQKGFGLILNALNNFIGCRLLTGYTTPFHQQPLQIRQQILQSWRESYIPTLNVLHKQLTNMAKSTWLKTSPSFASISGFPKAPNHYKPGTHYEYKFRQFSTTTAKSPGGELEEEEVFETDVVIVGSGCGGAVSARNIAEAGRRVVVVDKGYYFPPEQLPMSELQGHIHIFENGGVDMSEDGSSNLVAGSTWGGGGTVNWSASLQTQDFVRKEWADEGLTFFESAAFQKCLDRVCERMGVSTEFIEHNHGNQVLLEGSRKLGYTAKAVPQNTGGKAHNCGHCTLGCGSGQKQGPVMTWLPDAAKAGAEFVEGFQVDNVVFDEFDGVKKAVGVKGTWTGRDSNGRTDGNMSDRVVRKVFIKAKKVVVSCGTMWSPVILMKSGLTNHQIGKNLHIHPVNTTFGVFPEDVRPWEGPILSTACTSFENLDGKGHGVKLEATCMMPAWTLVLMNWKDGLDWKSQALKFRHTNGYISIVRDRDMGRIWYDPTTGRPGMSYTPSAFDRKHIMEGNVALAKILYVSGAVEIHVGITGVPPFIRETDEEGEVKEDEEGVTSPAFQAWLTKLREVGNKPITAAFSAAHQMGTCRMSVAEKDGVVDPKGRVFGTEGLYVADASVFPSASGVNPMVTTMAISDHISRTLLKDWKEEENL